MAIVTGASRGIGRCIAEQLADDGRHVVLVSRSEGPLQEVKAAIESNGGSADVHPADIGDSAAWTAAIEGVIETHGRLDILVNNAGITRDGLFLRMSDEDFDEVISVNLRSAFIGCRVAARQMMRGRWGRIVNISSVTGCVGNAGQANYAAAKSGLHGLTKTIAKEIGAKNVTANVIAPGFVETEMLESLPSSVLDDAKSKVPLRRFARPDEIAAVARFLCSDACSYLTGQVVVVDGGMIG
ncbi:MAG: 3-oxoacyl-[acyl-carrier-protein] reductase [Planctomycetota bacterium]